MTDRRPKQSENIGRALVARLIALAFLLQAIGLFAAPAPARSAASSRSAVVAMAAAPHCPHHAPSQNDGGKSDACPMCQALGCALAGAAAPAPVHSFRMAEIGALAPPISQPAPKMAPRLIVSARGPPLNA